MKFIITFPPIWNFSNPIEVEAPDRIRALVALRGTVWTEEEWKEAQKSIEEFEKKFVKKEN